MNRDLNSGITAQSKSGVHRLDDAKVLLKERRWRGAMYMAGYAVECSLKAGLMRKFDCQNLAELDEEMKRGGWLKHEDTIYTHGLERLLRAADGFDRLRTDPKVWSAFAMANRWQPAWRYDPNPSTPEDATAFLEAVDAVRHWIQNNI